MGYFKELQIKRRESKIFRSLCPRCKVWNNNIDIEIDGTLSLQDLSKLLMIEFSSEVHHKVNTINGYLTDLKGDFVSEGDEFDYEGFHFKVISANKHCAEKIKVTKVVKKKSKTVNI